MKRRLIAMTCLVPLSSNAAPEPSIAVKVGPDAATLTRDYRVDRYGFAGGAAGYLRRPISDQFSLGGEMELLYTPRGADVVFEGDLQGRVRLHYFDITIAARPELRLGPVSLYLRLGGGLALLLSANNENVSGVKEDIIGDLHRIDVALLVGAGVAWHLSRRGFGPFRLGTVFLEARHDRGLLDVDKQDLGFKNRTSSVMLGVSFVLGSSAPPPR